jgi:hypothetical protein
VPKWRHNHISEIVSNSDSRQTVRQQRRDGTVANYRIEHLRVGFGNPRRKGCGIDVAMSQVAKSRKELTYIALRAARNVLGGYSTGLRLRRL